jgi:hypothetical protein
MRLVGGGREKGHSYALLFGRGVSKGQLMGWRYGRFGCPVLPWGVDQDMLVILYVTHG